MDKVYLDTIYNGLLKAFAVAQAQQTSVSGEDFKITITPELTAKNYSVTFDLGDKFDKDSLLVFSDKVLSQWNVVTGTTAQATMQSGEKFSRAYIYTKENTTFQELLWTNVNQSATGYSELSSTLLHDAASGDNSMIELTLHPVRGDAASNLINVRAYDDNGVLLTITMVASFFLRKSAVLNSSRNRTWSRVVRITRTHFMCRILKTMIL